MKHIASKFGQDSGAEIAEAALVLPLVFMFLLGIVWFGRAFNIYSTIQQAAQQGAITAARSSCATCGNVGSVNGTVSSCPATTPPASVADTVAGVMCASNIDPTQIPANSNPPVPSAFCSNPPAPLGSCTATGNITVCRNAQLNSTQCVAIVAFQYPFKFYLPFTSLNMTQVTMTAQAQSRMEN